MISYKYSRWDGTQEPFQISPEELLDELSQDLLSYGDLQTALRRLMERGMTTRQGMRMQGLKDLLQRIQDKRRQQLGKYNLDSLFSDLQERLDRIIEKEKQGLQRRLDESKQKGQPGQREQGSEGTQGQEGQSGRFQQAKEQQRASSSKGGQGQGTSSEQGGEPDLQRLLQDMIGRKRQFLENLPDSFGGAVKELMDYEFMDEEARQEFQELMDLLRQRMLEPYMKEMQQRLRSLTPQQMQVIKDMLQDLNEMLEQHRMGLNPDYHGFMQQWGDFFPDAPDNLEDFVEQLQRQIAQMQSLMDSLSPEMRQSLQDLLNSDLIDEEMRDLLAQLGMNLETLFPSEEFRNLYPFQGKEQISWEEAMELMNQLQKMDNLEKQLEKARASRRLEGIDVEKLREVLGEEAQREIEELKDLTRLLEESGYVRRKGSRYELSPKGMRRIGQKALRDIFKQLKKERSGGHESYFKGIGIDDIEDTKTYEFGDRFALHIQKTVMNAVLRGSRVPVELAPSDLEVYRPDQMTRTATVLLLDQSRSMDISGAFIAAKKVALALHSLISTQFPKDDLYVIGFSDYARELKGTALAEADASGYAPGTNMQHALMLARQFLAKRKCDNKQVIMITDGEPTAHLQEGRALFWYPPSLETIEATLKEVKHCTRDSVVINIFMLDTSYYLMDFVNHVTKINKGRAFYTTPERLGEYILVDYMSHKRRRIAP